MASRFLTPFSGRGLLGRDPFLELHREVNCLFDDSLRGASQGSGSGALMSPSIDVCETEDGLEISAELPGVAEDDIDLRLDGDMLTISGEATATQRRSKSLCRAQLWQLHPFDPAALHTGPRQGSGRQRQGRPNDQAAAQRRAGTEQAHLDRIAGRPHDRRPAGQDQSVGDRQGMDQAGVELKGLQPG